jgi:hypothetical protein
LFFGVILAAPSQVLAQSATPLKLQRSQTYNDSFISSIVQTQDGGFVLAGSNTTVYPPVLSLMKTNRGGEIEWTKTYPEIESMKWIIQSIDSGYLLASQGSTCWFIKTDFQGNLEWCRKINDLLSVSGFTATDDGNYVILEGIYVSTHHTTSVFKYDVAGDLLWEKTFYEISAGAILQSNDSKGYYVVGCQGMSFWFTKLDAYGEVVWNHTYDYGLEETNLVVCSIIQTQDGGFLFGGFDDENNWLVRTDGSGEELWHQRYDNHIISNNRQYYYLIRDIVQDRNGQYLLLSVSGIVAIDELGNKLWAFSYSEYVSDLRNPANTVVLGVLDVRGFDDDLVVVVSYLRTATYPDSTDNHYGLWMANFILEPMDSTDNGWFGVELLVGIAVIVVVTAFVGFLVYFKGHRHL